MNSLRDGGFGGMIFLDMPDNVGCESYGIGGEGN